MQRIDYRKLSSDDKDLIDAAKQARKRAHAHLSGFKVGAAARFGNTIVHGCNVESDVYGLTNCAERTAVFAAHATGAAAKALSAIAVVADTPEPVSPCGACRQVLFEQGGAALRVILANMRGDIAITTMAELLPGGFRLETRKQTVSAKSTSRAPTQRGSAKA